MRYRLLAVLRVIIMLHTINLFRMHPSEDELMLVDFDLEDF